MWGDLCAAAVRLSLTNLQSYPPSVETWRMINKWILILMKIHPSGSFSSEIIVIFHTVLPSITAVSYRWHCGGLSKLADTWGKRSFDPAVNFLYKKEGLLLGYASNMLCAVWFSKLREIRGAGWDFAECFCLVWSDTAFLWPLISESSLKALPFKY